MKIIRNFTAYLVLLAAILASGGCDIFKPSNDDLLTDHIWNFDRITTTSTNETVQGIVTFANAMMIGSTLQFHTDGTYTITMGDETDDGTWNLINDDEVLMMDTDEMIVIKLTKDELVLESEEVDNEYGTYTVTMCWEK
ncbi:MAG: hypothetical protein RQ743_12530 [Bacteroidales bacterium]|nr:hypothetical protein [Bacteroidales bacterium]